MVAVETVKESHNCISGNRLNGPMPGKTACSRIALANASSGSKKAGCKAAHTLGKDRERKALQDATNELEKGRLSQIKMRPQKPLLRANNLLESIPFLSEERSKARVVQRARRGLGKKCHVVTKWR